MARRQGISVIVDDSELKALMKNLGHRLPKELSEFTEETAGRMVRGIKNKARQRRIIDTRSLISSITAQELRKNEWAVKMNRYGLAIDQDWAPHKHPGGWYVKIKRSRPRLKNWIMTKWYLATDYKGRYYWIASKKKLRGSYVKATRMRGVKGGRLLVQPRPFIREPIEREIALIDAKLRNITDKVVK
jgi:hypothetical protein